MKIRQSGFTLPETLIATAVLVSGLAGVAWVFTMSISANMANRHRAAAALLAAEKIEEFEASSAVDPIWSAGGGLDPLAPKPGYSDVVMQGADTYLRLWEVTGLYPRTLSVSVYVRPSSPSRKSTELIRASTSVAPGL